MFPQNKRGQVRGSVQDKAASRLNGYGERPAQGIQRGAGLVDGGNMGEVTQEAWRLSTVTWSSTRLLSPLTLVPPLMFPAYLSKP